MGAPPLVSVVIIFWNAARFLREAVESVLGQTHRSWELALVDDGSRDASPDIAREYARRFPGRVRYHCHAGRANLGMSASRNLGIALTKGRFVAFLDADDVWLPGILERQLALLESHPRVAMVYGPLLWWRRWPGAAQPGPADRIEDLGVPPDRVVAPPDLLPVYLQNRGAVPSGYLVRREVVEAVGGFEDRFRSAYEDQVFVSKVCAEFPVFADGEPLYKYRQHPGSCVAREPGGRARRTRRRAFLEWLARYLEERCLDTPALSQVLARELFPCRHPVRQALLRLGGRLRRRGGGRGRVLDPVAARISGIVRGTRGRGEVVVAPVDLGALRRRRPVGREWGFDRGTPVDRHYLEEFLSRNAGDIRGRVLEVGTRDCTLRHGGSRVERSEVLTIDEQGAGAAIVSDLTRGDDLPADAYDCVILTQTLQFIYDVRGALRTVHRILRPGGVLLASLPGISQISRHDMERWGDYWRFTTCSAGRLLEEAFGEGRVEVEAWGNVLAAVGFLHGLAAEELGPGDLAFRDRDYQVLITARVEKGGIRG